MVVVLTSDLMAQISDDPPGAPTSQSPGLAAWWITSDEKVGILKALLDKNPVYVYRMGNRLDEDSQVLTRGEAGEVPVHKLPDKDGLRQVAHRGATTTGRRSPPTTSPWPRALRRTRQGQIDQGLGRHRSATPTGR